jgi:hypothetical protein
MSHRDAYVAKAEAEFAEVQAQLSALASTAQNAVAAVRAEGKRLLQGAKSKHDEALHRLELLLVVAVVVVLVRVIQGRRPI